MPSKNWIAYPKLLQNPSEENFETYKIKRNTAKTTVCKTHKESWGRFVCRIDAEILGEQSMTYKVQKHLNLTNKDTIENNNIAYKKWIEDHKSLWCSNFPQNDNDQSETTPTPSVEIDEITDEEL